MWGRCSWLMACVWCERVVVVVRRGVRVERFGAAHGLSYARTSLRNNNTYLRWQQIRIKIEGGMHVSVSTKGSQICELQWSGLPTLSLPL